MPTKKSNGKRQRQPKGKKKQMWKTAKAAVEAVLKKEAEPNFVKATYGSYSVVTGLYVTPLTLNPGPAGGYLDSTLVRIAQPANVQSLGNPGTRKDLSVNITGIKARLRFFLPNNIRKANVAVYLGFDKNHERRTAAQAITVNYFDTPDCHTVLREDSLIKEDLAQLVNLKRKNFIIQAETQANSAQSSSYFKDISIWRKPKQTFQLKYDGDLSTSYLNRSFYLAIKASYDPSGTDRVKFGGSVVTYYRDL